MFPFLLTYDGENLFIPDKILSVRLHISMQQASLIYIIPTCLFISKTNVFIEGTFYTLYTPSMVYT